MADYTLTLRPISIGTYPTTDPAPEIVADNYPAKRADWGNDYGTLRYAAPLSFERIWRYDLRPVDDVERAKYAFWLYADRDAARAAEMEADWRAACAADLAEIQRLAAYDNLAAAALVLWFQLPAAALILWEAVWNNTTP